MRASDQEFSFTFQQVSLNDDPALAMAYYSSLRSTIEPHFSFPIVDHVSSKQEGVLKPRRRRYLDALHLRHQLRIVRQHEIATESASKNHKDKRDLYTLREADVNSGAFSHAQTVQDNDAAEAQCAPR